MEWPADFKCEASGEHGTDHPVAVGNGTFRVIALLAFFEGLKLDKSAKSDKAAFLKLVKRLELDKGATKIPAKFRLFKRAHEVPQNDRALYEQWTQGALCDQDHFPGEQGINLAPRRVVKLILEDEGRGAGCGLEEGESRSSEAEEKTLLNHVPVGTVMCVTCTSY